MTGIFKPRRTRTALQDYALISARDVRLRAPHPAHTPRLRLPGILEPRRLHTALRDYALTAALNDRRFAPVSPREVPSLECTVSLLSCFEEAAAWDDWE
eukprot:360424-Chlamydomonas_euryale.AAC.1